MKKLISTIMCLALLVGCLAGCGGNTQTGAADGKGLKMLLSLSQADTFRNVLVAQAQQTAEECGAQLDVFDAGNIFMLDRMNMWQDSIRQSTF